MKIKLKNSNLKNPESKRDFNLKLFDEVSKSYDKATVALSFGFDKFWKKILVKNLPNFRNPYCLDIATGTGDIAFLLRKKYPSAKIFAIDINKMMLEKAKRKINDIEFIIMDMNSLNFNEEMFDVVTGGYALRNAPEIQKLLISLYKIMKKNSIAAFLEFNKISNKFLQKIEIFLLKLWGNLWGLIFHKNPDIYGYIAESLKFYPDNKKLVSLLKEIGFKDIKYKKLFLGFIAIVFFRK